VGAEIFFSRAVLLGGYFWKQNLGWLLFGGWVMGAYFMQVIQAMQTKFFGDGRGC
jgi:hypothetical protein